MPSPALAGLLARLRPTEPGTDAVLLGRYVRSRDTEAFAEIVRRHGAMVLATCRRVLGDRPEADDAHQIAFMALARDAGKISTPHALAGWLHRVAWLSARKLAGRLHRHKPQPLTTDPAMPMPPAPEQDLRAVIDEELLGLPERFRAVAVLCLFEGHTHSDAATALGIPKGTVDSRLSTAKAKLRERLTRRGITAAVVLTLDQVLSSDVASAAGRAATLAEGVISAALDYAAGATPVGSEHLIHTVNGVRPVGTNLKWLAAMLFTTAVIGGGGAGVYLASAGENDKPTAEVKAPAEEQKPKADPPKPATTGELNLVNATTADDVMKALKTEVSIPEDGVNLGEVFDMIQKEHGVNIRLDTASFRRRGWGEGVPEYEDLQKGIYSMPVRGTGLKRVPVEDALRELLAQVRGGGPQLLSYRIKGNTILIVPEYQPPTIPGGWDIGGEPIPLMVTQEQLIENLYGEPVTVRYKNKPLPEVIEDLQNRTGANIVANTNTLPDVEKVLVTANFNDARLLTVLKIVGDMCNLKPVVVDNVFYLTSPEKAEQLQAEVTRSLFGTPPVQK